MEGEFPQLQLSHVLVQVSYHFSGKIVSLYLYYTSIESSRIIFITLPLNILTNFNSFHLKIILDLCFSCTLEYCALFLFQEGGSKRLNVWLQKSEPSSKPLIFSLNADYEDLRFTRNIIILLDSPNFFIVTSLF